MEIKGKLIKTLSQAHRALIEKQFSCVDLVEKAYKNIESNKALNAFVTLPPKTVSGSMLTKPI